MKSLDLVGQRFNRLQVISKNIDKSKGGSRWNCLCDCGQITVVQTGNLKSGNTKSCGCMFPANKLQEFEK